MIVNLAVCKELFDIYEAFFYVGINDVVHANGCGAVSIRK